MTSPPQGAKPYRKWVAAVVAIAAVCILFLGVNIFLSKGEVKEQTNAVAQACQRNGVVYDELRNLCMEAAEEQGIEPIIPGPGSTEIVQVPGQTVQIPGPALPGQTVTLPGPTVVGPAIAGPAIPGEMVTIAAPPPGVVTQTLPPPPRETVTLAAPPPQTVTQPAPPAETVVVTETAPGETVTQTVTETAPPPPPETVTETTTETVGPLEPGGGIFAVNVFEVLGFYR